MKIFLPILLLVAWYCFSLMYFDVKRQAWKPQFRDTGPRQIAQDRNRSPEPAAPLPDPTEEQLSTMPERTEGATQEPHENDAVSGTEPGVDTLNAKPAEPGPDELTTAGEEVVADDQPADESQLNATDPETAESTVRKRRTGTLIYFPYGSEDRISDARIDAYLDELAGQLKSTNQKVRITGHTDNRSSAAFNKQLGLWRAEAVRDILLGKGVNGTQIETLSRGEEDPIATNNTAAGRSQNRRIEIEMIK